MPAEIEGLSVRLERVARNQARAQFRESAFLFPWKMSVEIFRYDKLENSVAQKFQPLIIEMGPMRLVPKARMSERFREQERVPEFVADAFFERIHPNEILT